MNQEYQDKTPSLSAQESESIALYAATKAIDSMVNHNLFNFIENDQGTFPQFKTSTDASLFNILLADFLADKHNDIIGNHSTGFSALNKIIVSPAFNIKNSVEGLIAACNNFKEWLDYKINTNKVWFSEISLEVDITLSRRFYITICGNISKHNVMSLSQTAKQIQKLLLENDYKVNQIDSYMMLENFYTWFHNDIFLRHSPHIAYHLNTIRHEINNYMHPTVLQSKKYKYDERFKTSLYVTTRPTGFVSSLGEYCFYELISATSRPSFVESFNIPDYLLDRD